MSCGSRGVDFRSNGCGSREHEAHKGDGISARCVGLWTVIRSMFGVAGAVKSIDIMTLRANMFRMEKTNSLLAQSRSSEVL